MLSTSKLVAIIRISLGWIFFWAFLDKLFGLGFSTPSEKSWLSGVSPTSGFLLHGTHGPLSDIFQSMAGQMWVDYLFMFGMLAVGIALLLGIGLKIAGYSGSTIMLLIFLAGSLPPEHNLLIDEHIIYILVLIFIAQYHQSTEWGLGKWWKSTSWVKRYPILE